MSRLPWWLPMGSVPELEPLELAQRLAQPIPPRLLDVRTELEFRRSHIQGSHNVPITQLPGRLAELRFEATMTVVAVCRSAHRSIPAVRLLLDHGLCDVFQLAGGMQSWWAAGLPTQGDGGPE